MLTAFRGAAGSPDVLVRICEALTTSLPCDRATIYVLSQRHRAFLPVADHGTPAEVVGDFIRRGFRPGSFPYEADLRAGRVVSASLRRPGRLAEVLEVARLHDLTVVPLAFQGGAAGSLAFGMHGPPGFRPSQLALLEQLAPHIAVLIQNARLEARASRLAARRGRLAGWAAEVLDAGDPAEMARRLCDAGITLFGATGAGLMLVEDGALVTRHVVGGPCDNPPTARIPLDADRPAAEALRHNRVVVLNRFRASSHAIHATRALGTAPAALLIAPLVDGAGPLGVLVVSDRQNAHRFAPADENDAQLLAALATVALRKALLLEELRRASAAKDAFLANVSHDLRTPLNVIVGYSQLLAEETFGPVTPDQAETLSRVLRTAREQIGLINDLLDLARIEQGKLACERRPVPVAELLPSLTATMDILLRDRPVRFETVIDGNAVAATDAERLRQVLLNLLTNAARFTREGCVRLVAAREGDAVSVSVLDTGPGIAPDIAAHALDPFVRSPDGGSGLGLAIVARLLQLLGGTLTIDSGPGRGTGVHVRLPAA